MGLSEVINAVDRINNEVDEQAEIIQEIKETLGKKILAGTNVDICKVEIKNTGSSDALIRYVFYTALSEEGEMKAVLDILNYVDSYTFNCIAGSFISITLGDYATIKLSGAIELISKETSTDIGNNQYFLGITAKNGNPVSVNLEKTS